MTASSGYRLLQAAAVGEPQPGRGTPVAALGSDRPEIIDQWADIFQAMSDTNRLRILLAIHHSPGINVTDLAEAVGMSANATSHALGALRIRGIVRSERAGRECRWRIQSDQIHALLHQVGATHSPLHLDHQTLGVAQRC